jgi:hypothetical protein
LKFSFSKLTNNQKLYIHLFLGWFLLYFLFTPGKLFTVDSLGAAETAQAAVQGRLAIEENLLTLSGPDGKEYFRHELLWSILLVPGVIVSNTLEFLLPETLAETLFPQGATGVVLPLYNHAVTALILIFLFHFLCKLKVSPQHAFIAIVSAGLCTMLFPYSRDLFRQPLAGLLNLVIFYSLWDLRESKERERSLIAGVALAAAILSRYTTLAFLPVFFLGFLARVISLSGADRWKKTLPSFFIPILLAICLHFFTLWFRWGNDFFSTLHDQRFGVSYLQSIPLFFLYPELGLLSYCPFWIFLLWGFPTLWRQKQKWLVLMIGTLSVSYLLLYGKYELFYGGQNPGPRYLLPLIPLWFIPLGVFLGREWNQPGFRLGWIIIALIGFIVNFYEALTDYTLYRTAGLLLMNILSPGLEDGLPPWQIDHLCAGWWPYLLFRSSVQAPAWIAFLLVAAGTGYFLISAWRLTTKPDTSALEEEVPACREE